MTPQTGGKQVSKNALTVHGIRRIMDGLVDSVNDGLIKSHKLSQRGSDIAFTSKGTLTLDGVFGFDKDGQLGFTGTVSGTGLASGAPVDATAAVGTDRRWHSEGAGTMTATFEVQVTLHRREDQTEEDVP